MSFTIAALVVAWLAIALLALGFAGLMRQMADLARAQGATPAGRGRLAPQLSGLGLPSAGPLGVLRPPGGGIVVFVSPGCPSCAAALAQLEQQAADRQLLVVTSATCEATPVPPGAACVDQAQPLDAAPLAIPGTPYLMGVDAEGVIGATVLAQNAEQVGDFLTHRGSVRPLQAEPLDTEGGR